MTIKVILFDFDGTLADTHDTIVEITNRLSAEFGYQPVAEAELSKLKHLSSREIVRYSKISLFKIPFLLKRVQEELGKQISKIKPISGMEATLVQLKNREYQLGIITSNLRENVLSFLREKNWQLLFDFICQGKTIFGKHRVLKKFIKQNYFQAEEVIYVGDETRDILAAKKSKIKVIAVEWGFNSPEVLAKHKPDFLIKNPQEIMAVIENLNQPAVKC